MGGRSTSALRTSSNEFQDYLLELPDKAKNEQNHSPRQSMAKYQKLYDEIYPRFYNNSFLLSACSLFEYQAKIICDLIQKEHNMPFGWDEKKSPPIRVKHYLSLAGVTLKDSPPDSFEHWYSTNMPGNKPVIPVKEMWKELHCYFMLRNCLAHHNGIIEKSRGAYQIRNYAVKKEILDNNRGQLELGLTKKFNTEVCETMGEYFKKLMGAYYFAPLPE